jgi:hypothetical protein
MMGAKHGITKMKKAAQAKSDASGWNKHVNKSQKRVANRVLRRMLREEDGDVSSPHRARR